ncbi:hypothetical protein O181_021146 [Austropuccinia psidii MF-1]|uniref:Integrase catalytic domain-containing protein n=1 Tax=Austropuccinia psidii MF-1 TaxID=1389203 RepID=A0A9Q3CEW6_9BASI|nr:hypothetical protein [Austropuccinia psidii MF-1]
MNESSNPPISSLSDIQGLEKLNSSNFFTWQRGIVSSLGTRNLRDMLIEPPSTIKTDPNYLKKKEMVYYFIVGHLDHQNYDKFVSDEDEEPYKLWHTIKEHYAFSSGENIASNFGKLFSIKFPPSSSCLSEAISSFRSTLELLRGLSHSLFAADIMVQVLAFYVLLLLPETCRHVSTAVFHSIKVSAKIPTVEELFKKVKLDILRKYRTEDQTSLALQLCSKPKKELCHKGNHNPLSNNSKSDCFQLFPEKREAYHCRRTDKNGQETTPSLAVFNNINNVLNKPVLDSGFSNTIASTCNLFSNIIPSSEILLSANGSNMKVTSEGTLHLNTTDGKISIPNSLVIPLASSVLVSLGPFLNNRATLKGFKGGAYLFNQHGNLILTTKIVNNILLINTPPLHVSFSSSTNLPLILHKSLGHPSNRVATKMWPGVDFSAVNCDSCSLAKSHRLPFSGTLPSPLNVLEIVHMNLCGPISPASHGGNCYIFQIIDGHSHMRFLYLLSSKLECFEHFIKFQRLVENLKGRKIKTVVSDNCGEFFHSKFKNLFDIKGICHIPTAPYTPQQNPIAERGSQSLLERIRVMMHDNSIPAEWWGEASGMAAFVLNRTPVSILNFVAPVRECSSGDISANPEVIRICDTTSPSYYHEPSIPFEGDSSPLLPEQPETDSPGT